MEIYYFFAIALVILILLGIFFTLYKNREKVSFRINQERKFKVTDSSVEILKLEFEYAKESSLKSQADRLTLLNHYIAIYTLIVTIAIGFSQLSENSNIDQISAMLFLSLALISVFFMLILVRLRQVWIGAARVMNKIKEYFFKADPAANEFFLWKTETIPIPENLRSITSFSIFMVSLLGTIALGVSLYLLTLPTLIIILLSILYFSALNLTAYLMLYYDL